MYVLKRTGLIILAIGLLITLYKGLKYVIREKVVDLGSIRISKTKNHFVSWSPLVGIATMFIGDFFYLFGTKRE